MADALNLYLAGGAADAIRSIDGPVAALVRWGDSGDRPLGGELLGVGALDEILQHPAAEHAARVDLGGHTVLTPGFVNSHTHLDLTHVGPFPFDREGGFFGWIERIRSLRTESQGGIRESVRLGIQRSLAGGVVAVGDIAGIGRAEPLEELRASPLIGVSFLELFGLANGCARALHAAQHAVEAESETTDRCGVRLGLQPHAPYSAGRELYKGCAAINREHGAPISTHLAESAEEHQYIQDGTGHIGAFLASLGLQEAAEAEGFGAGDTPIEHVLSLLNGQPTLCAHVNDASDGDLALLADSAVAVAYCPRSHRYFGHEANFGRHRWKEMRERGIEVALGTDSIVNIPATTGDGLPTLSTLDEARVLWSPADGDAHALLDLVTCAGARVLGLESEWFTLSDGPIAGMCAVVVEQDLGGVPAIERVLNSASQPALLHPACDGFGAPEWR